MNEITWFLFGVAVGIWSCVLQVNIYLRHKAKHYKHGAPKPDYTIPTPHAYTPAPPKTGSCVHRPEQIIRIVIEGETKR